MSEKQFEASIKAYTEALKIYESLNDLQGKSIAHTHLGNAFSIAADDRKDDRPSTPPVVIIPPPPRVPPTQNLASINQSVKAFSRAVEISQAEDDPSIQAFFCNYSG